MLFSRIPKGVYRPALLQCIEHLNEELDRLTQTHVGNLQQQELLDLCLQHVKQPSFILMKRCPFVDGAGVIKLPEAAVFPLELRKPEEKTYKKLQLTKKAF